eukprot:4016614-Amphidinium_carterae.1
MRGRHCGHIGTWIGNKPKADSTLCIRTWSSPMETFICGIHLCILDQRSALSPKSSQNSECLWYSQGCSQIACCLAAYVPPEALIEPTAYEPTSSLPDFSAPLEWLGEFQ